MAVVYNFVTCRGAVRLQVVMYKKEKGAALELVSSQSSTFSTSVCS